MKPYTEFIEAARLIPSVTSQITTGDVEYPGTALEVSDKDGKELFHIVVDLSGEVQVLFFAQKAHYRLPLSLLEQILNAAKEKVGKALG
jgi:hypothetical protein